MCSHGGLKRLFPRQDNAHDLSHCVCTRKLETRVRLPRARVPPSIPGRRTTPRRWDLRPHRFSAQPIPGVVPKMSVCCGSVLQLLLGSNKPLVFVNRGCILLRVRRCFFATLGIIQNCSTTACLLAAVKRDLLHHPHLPSPATLF